ncbi:MAG TPA: ATP-binding protein [Actinomycetota bacterium]
MARRALGREDGLTAIAQPTLPARRAADGGFAGSALRSERSIALIRIAIVGVVMWIYLSSLGIRRSLGPAAIVILALAGLYGLVSLLVLVNGQMPSWRARVVTVLVDILLITLWVQATGGPSSEFWTLYLIVVVSAALRFRLPETLGVALGLTVLHLSLTVAQGGLERYQIVYRPTLMIATGVAVGVLAYQRGVHRRERSALEALVETRGAELGQERAEVERLRRVDTKRSEFVAIAAHEFRTPLAAVIGVLSTLKAHGDVLEDDVKAELIEGAQAQAERLSRLVEDLLTVSRIEDGVLRLHPERVKPRTLVADAERASGTSGRVQVELHRVDPVVCDADAIVRVLTNLLDNAKKYSPEGSPIEIAITQDERSVRFAVRDHGPGIDPEDREAVFERFRRLGDGAKPGAGLGLYISRGLVEAHGGEVTVGEAPEGGAEFAFTLPRRSTAEDADDWRALVTKVTAVATGTR